MCGRYTLTVDPAELREMLELGELPTDLQPRYNIAPTQNVPVVTSAEDRKVELFHWGLIPSWAKDPSMSGRMINARAETLHEKPAYRVPFARKRCLVLADGFFEWQHVDKSKRPFFIQLKSREPFAFAGLWDHWTSAQGEEKNTCTIVTCDPNELMSKLHNRMPVILDRSTMWEWLEPTASPVALRALLAPYAGPMIAHPVSRLVNSPQNDSPDCIKPEKA
ncbi:MAG TPA: SOS response-associated peptidase [Anaerolineae bacterium]|nr:SOS response-associated peptidase [Anaerolineae bacterium]